MSSHGTDPVKVKVIVTQFVQTDEAHFKSVVQTLTGKDSVVATEPEAGRGRRRTADCGTSRRPGGDNSGSRGPGNPAAAGQGDLDRMIMELPSLEQLRQLLAD